jgi:hypothetical protein
MIRISIHNISEALVEGSERILKLLDMINESGLEVNLKEA